MDYYLDVPASCAKQIDDRALQKLSKEMNVQVELRGQRLCVGALGSDLPPIHEVELCCSPSPYMCGPKTFLPL